jgi:hypothetical protein
MTTFEDLDDDVLYLTLEYVSVSSAIVIGQWSLTAAAVLRAVGCPASTTRQLATS